LDRTPPERDRVLESYLDGVAAVRTLAAQCSDWTLITPCRDWQAIDLAGHLRCVAENYLEYLQDAPDSRLARLFAQDAASAVLIRQQARQNAAELAVLPPEPGPERIMAFTVSAGAYADLLPDAWDLAQALDLDYRPADPDVLVAAWHWGVPHLPLHAGDPWAAVLRSSGRPLDWSRDNPAPRPKRRRPGTPS